MRILINGYHFGANTPPYVKAFQARGHEVRLTTAAAYGISDLLRRHPLAPELTTQDLLMPEYSWIEARVLRLLRRARIPFWRQFQARRMLGVLREFRPDIVWNHSLWIDTDVMIWTDFHPQVTLAYGYNEVEEQPGRAWVRKEIYARSDAFVDGLPEFRRYFIERESVPAQKYPPTTLYVGVPQLKNILSADRSASDEIRRSLGIPGDAVVLLETRGLRHNSAGALDAVRAVRALRTSGKNVKLFLIEGLLGKTVVVVEAENLARALGVQEDVVFVRGEMSTEDLLRYYLSADIYLSLLTSDGLGKSIMEAAAAGCLLVLTDLPNYRPAFGANAEYVQPADSDAVAGAVQRIMNLSPAEKALRIDANRQWLRENQDFDRASDRLLAYFESIVTNYRQRHPGSSGRRGPT